MSHQTGIIAGTLNLPDGTPLTGRVEIIPNVAKILDSAGDVVLLGRAKADLVNGSFSVTVPASNDTTLNPTGFTYVVAIKGHNASGFTVTGVNVPAGTTVQLADVVDPDPSSPGYALQVTRTEFDALKAQVAAGGGGGGAVSSVNAKTGTVVLSAADVGADALGAATAAQAAAIAAAATDATTKAGNAQSAAIAAAAADATTKANNAQTAATSAASTDATSKVAAHAGNTANPHAVTKAQVGLANVDNTSDASKPVSTAQATAIGAKADTTALTAHTSNVANPHATTKAQVGLGNVDNTADTAKPVSTAQAAALAAKVTTTDARPTVRLGIFPESSNPTSEAEFVAASGEPVTVLMLPYNFTQQPDTTALNALNARGVTPVITWMYNGATEGTTNPSYRLSAILAGTYDAYMTTFLNTLKGLSYPVTLKWAPEMNGDWAAWSEGQNGNTTGQYAQAWRYIWNLAKTLGVTNVDWQWAPTSKYLTSTPMLGLYPGNAYVDSIAVHGYNYGASGPDGVRSASAIFDTTFDEIATFGRGKPLWVGETGAKDTAGDKAAWIADFFDWVVKRGLAGFVWFNSSNVAEGYDWRVNSSTAAANAWTAGVASLRRTAKATGKAVAQADGPNMWVGRQNFYGAEVVGIPAAALPTPADIGAAPAVTTFNWFTASMTLETWQAGRQLNYDVTTTAGVFTIPTNATAAFPIGSTIDLYQNNTGQLSIAAASGVTIRSRGGALKLYGQYAMASLRKLDTNTWILTGDITT